MERLDRYLVQEGLLPSREMARSEVIKGNVLVNGRAVTKPAHRLRPEDEVTYTGTGRPFVSRGALKLKGAMEAFSLSFKGKRCIDIGASTGGFTHFMLEQGAEFVHALDVGHDQLDPLLKKDDRVRDLSGVNFRELTPALKKELKGFDFLTMDISFISVCHMVDSVKQVLRDGGEAVILIKPQFEAGRGAVNRQGVVKDKKKHREVLEQAVTAFLERDFILSGLTHSPIKGPHGNSEYLCYLKTGSREKMADFSKPDPLKEPYPILFDKVVDLAFQMD